MLHTDRKVPTQIPARIPYRVVREISIGPSFLGLFGSIRADDSARGMRGSRSDDMMCLGIYAKMTSVAFRENTISRARAKSRGKHLLAPENQSVSHEPNLLINVPNGVTIR